MHIIAAKAVAFGEALRPDFKPMPRASSTMPARSPRPCRARVSQIVSGGTDSHVMLVDLRPKKATGAAAEKVLDRAGITVNKNSIPGDPEKFTVTSGVRLGSPAGTTRGFGVGEFRQVGHLIADVLDGIARQRPGRRRRGRGTKCAVQGAGALRALSDLPRLTDAADGSTGGEDALSILRSRGHPG